MTDTDYLLVKKIFISVAKAPPEQRESILAAGCQGDEELRHRVEDLLAADKANENEPDPFLENACLPDLLRSTADRAVQENAEAVRIGTYDVVRQIGEGGMSVVYEAIQPQPKRRVAVKLIRAPHLPAKMQDRLAREADLLARLDHPGITKVFDAGVADVEYSTGILVKQRYQVMELIDGLPLIEHARANQLRLDDRLALMVAVCDAVHHAHQQGVIHRDLKPSNILVNKSGQPKVLDFGISRLLDSETTIGGGESVSISHLGHVLGTLAYMSPEQADGKGRMDSQTDVYALGVLLFQLLSDQLPIEVDDVTLTEALRRIVHAPPRRLATVAPSLKGDLVTVVETALAKAPERRYASAAELSADLQRFRNHEPISARPPTVVYVLWKLAERHRLLAATVLLATVSIVLGTMGTAWFAVSAHKYAAESEGRARIARQESYRSSIAAAAYAIDNDNVGAARRLLDQTPAGLRNWEWAYLRKHTDESSLTIPWQVTPGHQMHTTQFVEFTPDGDTLVLPDPRHPEKVTCWDADTGAPVDDKANVEYIWRVSESNGVIQCADRISQDVQTLSLEGLGLVFSGVTSRRYEFICVPDPADNQRPVAARFTVSPDSRWYVVNREPYYPIEVRRCDTHAVVARLDGLALRTDVVRFTQDGRRVITGSWDGRLRLWDVASGRLLAKSRRHHRDALLHLALHEPSQLIATASADQTIRLWRLDDLEHVRVLRGHARAVQHVAFDTKGQRLVSADRECIKTWNISGINQGHDTLMGHHNYVYGVAISPDGSRIASACFDGSVGLWDTQSRKLIRMLQPTSKQAWRVAFNQQGDLLRVRMDDYSSVVVDAETGDIVAQHPVPVRFVSDRLALCQIEGAVRRAWHPTDLTVQLTAPRSGEQETIPLTDERFDGTSFVSPDSRFAVWRHQVFDRRSGKLVREFPSSVVFRPDGKQLITTAKDDRTQIVVWDTHTWEPVARLGGHTEPVLAMAYSPDGSRLATGGYDRVIYIWDTGAHEEVLQLTGHTGYVNDLAWSADGTTLVSASGDHSIRIWDSVSTPN